MLQFLFAKPNSANGKWLDVPEGAEAFTYHHKSGGRVLLAGFLMAAAAETVVVHVILAFWNHWVALVATLLSVWFALQVLAQIRTYSMRPMYVLDNHLMIRNGAFDLVELQIETIDFIETSSGSRKWDSGGMPPLRAGFPAEHNVVLQLKGSAEATILNRKKREFKTALLFVDEKERFVELIRSKMETGGAASPQPNS